MCTSAFILSFYVNFQVDMLYNVFEHSFFRRQPLPSSFFSSFFIRSVLISHSLNCCEFEKGTMWYDTLLLQFTCLALSFFMHLNFRSIICWRLYVYLWGTLRLSLRNFGITCNFNNHLEQYSDITITILAVLFFNLIFFSLEIVNSPLNLLGFYRIRLCEKRIKKSSNNKNKTSKKSHL